MDINWGDVWQAILNWLATSGVRLLLAVVILIVSFRLINLVGRRIVRRAEARHKFDKTIAETLVYFIKIILKIAIAVSLVSFVGIDTSGIAALITSFGVALGVAFNGTLGNVAGGVLILITRPFRIDDYIKVGEYEGTVEDIRIVHTRIHTIDNKVIYLPNGTVATSSITNFSEKKLRRLDLTFSVSYEEDFRRAQALLLELCEKHERILKDPAPTVRMSAHSASSIDLTVRAWVANADYWTVRFDLLEQVKTAFDEQKISIPYSQLDVHIKDLPTAENNEKSK